MTRRSHAPVAHIPGVRTGNALRSRLLSIRRFYRQTGKPMAFRHCREAITEGISAGIINSIADRKEDPLSCDIVDILGYHVLNSRIFEGGNPARICVRNAANTIRPGLPEEGLRRNIALPLAMFLKMRALMCTENRHMKDFAAMLGEEEVPIRTRAAVLFAHMADAMTVHGPGIFSGAYGNQNMVFPYKSADWRRKANAMAVPMLRVLCPFADLFGFTEAYRKIRDTAAEYLYPDTFAYVKQTLETLAGRIRGTNELIGSIMARLQDACAEKGIPMRVIRREQKSAGSITMKLEKLRKNGVEAWASGLHDVVARLLITKNDADLCFVTEYLKTRAIPETLLSLGQSHFISHQDYVNCPKPRTNYQSHHLDTTFVFAPGRPAPCLHFEFILRTEDMHNHADRGGAAHHLYKEGEVPSKLLASYSEVVAEIRKNGSNGKLRS